MTELHNKMRQDKASEYESKYMAATLSGDRREQINAIINLMAIKAIDSSDNRIAMLVSEKAPMTNRDFRRNGSFTPKWFYFNFPSVISFEMKCREHEGERREGAYAGKVKFPSRTLKMAARELADQKKIENAFSDILKIMEKRGSSKKLGKTTLGKMLDGEYAVYNVSLSAGQNCIHSDFGFILLAYMEKSNATMIIPILDWQYIDDCYANHNEFQEDIIELIKSSMRESNESGLRFKIQDVMK